MWIVVGSKHKYVPKPGGLLVTKPCAKCRGPTRFFEVVPKEYFTVFWVPLFATSEKEPVLECSDCHDRYRISQSDYRLAVQQDEQAPTAQPTSPSRVVVACPSCATGLRIPNLKDLVRVTCPKCSNKVEVREGSIKKS